MYSQLLLLIGFGVPIAVIDQRVRKIPNQLLVALLISSIVARVIFDHKELWISLQVAGAGALFCALLFAIFRHRIGMGDLKLMIVLASVLADFHRAVFGFFFSLIIGGLICLVTRKKSLAFAPALLLAALITL
jgi:Flp pilus assembly protein protease CpaA